MIFYKENLHTYLSLIENINDCIIWVKLEQVGHDDIFVAFCYFPPENSIPGIMENLMKHRNM